MSKPRHLFVLSLLIAGCSIFGFATSNKPALLVSIRIESPGDKTIAFVGGEFVVPRRAEFRKSFSLPYLAAIARKAEGLELRDEAGEIVAFRELSPGEYAAERDIKRWSYVVDLSSIPGPQFAAHQSWISNDIGLVMTRDFWPAVERDSDRAFLNLKLPVGWQVSGPKPLNGSVQGAGTTGIGDWFFATEKSVFAIGKGWRAGKSTDPIRPIELSISGKWQFTDDDVSTMAAEIAAEYTKLFGRVSSNPRIIVAKFPTQSRPGEWQAETRGDTVTIISSDMPFRTQSLQRLHEQLRHELFHLWIPNGINLTGNYDWFYEGFAMYQSLKLAVSVNRIRFEDFLDTLSRAHTIDYAIPPKVSLVGSANARLSGANSQVYARGMLIAFLCDMTLLEESKGRRSIEALLKTLFVNHGPPAAPVDGNEAVISLLRSNKVLVPIVDRYATGTEKVEWTSYLTVAGLEDSDPGTLTALRVVANPGGRQKTLLDKLGYNNWRRLSPNSK